MLQEFRHAKTVGHGHKVSTESRVNKLKNQIQNCGKTGLEYVEQPTISRADENFSKYGLYTRISFNSVVYFLSSFSRQCYVLR